MITLIENPFLLDRPEYREGSYRNGRFTLEKQDLPILRGYYVGLQATDGPNYALFEEHKKGERTLWMSVTPMERESQFFHAIAASGHTVIMGLGMGMLLYNVIRKEEVIQVTVVEKNPEVVELLPEITDFENWEGAEKVEFVIEDARKWKPNSTVDVLLVDIWPNLGDEQLRPDLIRIQRNVQAAEVAAWGQELDFATWLKDQDFSPPPTADQFYDYREDLGVPLMGDGAGDRVYARLVMVALENVMLY